MPRSRRPVNVSAPQLVVEVTDEGWETAKRCSDNSCAVANATKAAFFNKFGRMPSAVSVDEGGIRLSDKQSGFRYFYQIPPKVSQKIIAFDRGVMPTAVKFRLGTGLTAQAVPMRTDRGGKKSTTSKSRKVTQVVATNSRQGSSMTIVGGRLPAKLGSGQRVFGRKADQLIPELRILLESMAAKENNK